MGSVVFQQVFPAEKNIELPTFNVDFYQIDGKTGPLIESGYYDISGVIFVSGSVQEGTHHHFWLIVENVI